MLKSVQKSIFRWEALTALAVVLLVLAVYIFVFLEFHLKWIAEKTAFESIGAEVNIDSVDIDFWEPAVRIHRIQVTNPDKPQENSIELSKVEVKFLYKPLLRASFVSNSTSVLGIKFHTQRARPGRVLSKEKRILILKDPSRAKVHDALKGRFKKTAFSDVANLFSKDKRKEIEQKYKEKLKTLRVSKEIEQQTKLIKEKTKEIEKSVKSPEVKKLLSEVKAFKFKSGSTKESIDSTARALSLVKKLKSKRKEIKVEVRGLQKEIADLKAQVKSAPSNFLQDSNMLKASLDPKSLSPNKISEEILSEYFSIQLSQVDRVTSTLKHQALGDKAKFIEPSSESAESAKNKSEDEQAGSTQISIEKEKERAYKKYGKNFIFYKAALLPEYWFKSIKISSKASEGQDFGDVKGLISDFSASPELIDQPMVIKIEGSVPKQGIGSFKIDSTIDHRKVGEETEKVSIEVSDYLIKGLELFEGSDEWIKILKSEASTKLDVFLENESMNLVLNQVLRSPSYDVFSKDENVKRMMKLLKSSKQDLTLRLKAKGSVKSPKLRISSNLGDIILKIVKKELSAQAGALVSGELNKLSASAAEKLSPYLKDIDASSLKAGNLNTVFEKEIEKGLQKLKTKNKTKQFKKDLKKKLMNKLFDKL